jgi:hypothetical protein
LKELALLGFLSISIYFWLQYTGVQYAIAGVVSEVMEELMEYSGPRCLDVEEDQCILRLQKATIRIIK